LIFQKYKEYLFNSFYYPENVANISSIGLKITIIKNFVDLDKGQTFLESEVGVGGIFTII
jgi:K+-sensing histidine kinase KdpD